MENSVYHIIESIKADYRQKRFKKKESSGIDSGMKALGVALKFKLQEESILVED
jgi:hypothetical protein